ncbi:hypothetical protein SAY87_005703 [Trapa incisa]|uniref:Uncharacterized protein n=1 Tax=Trapa incisa TaxID=236973 RepID=A0AAN7KCX8_9MYRT|nr:hypothetical protein SAY87_005703 [Trapa incisa]
MASSLATSRLFVPLLALLLIQLGSLSVPVSGRPCKTLFVSSYSFSSIRLPAFIRNPNPEGGAVYVDLPASGRPYSSWRYVAIFTATFPADRMNRESDFVGETSIEAQRLEERKQDGVFGLFDTSSLRDRSKDILSVVVALLFGVGCGALTAVTIYMAWYVMTNGGSDYFEESDDEYESYASPKQMGYVKIPSSTPSLVPAKA